MKQIALLSLAGALLAACATPAESPAPEAPAAMPEAPAPKVAPGGFDYESVFRQDDRPEQDYELYPVRKSAEVLSFAGVMPGMTIVEANHLVSSLWSSTPVFGQGEHARYGEIAQQAEKLIVLDTAQNHILIGF